MCFAYCYFTWMFQGSSCRMMYVQRLTTEVCFHIHALNGEGHSAFNSNLSLQCLHTRRIYGITTCLETNHKPICNWNKCDVATWCYQHTCDNVQGNKETCWFHFWNINTCIFKNLRFSLGGKEADVLSYREYCTHIFQNLMPSLPIMLVVACEAWSL